MTAPATIHASAALVGETGILIRGASGSGKSTALLAILDADPDMNRLVADDRVIVYAAHNRLIAEAPAEIAGLVEMRGVGILSRPHVAPVVIRLVVDLEAPEACPRLPEPDATRTSIAGIILPRLVLPTGGNDGAARVRAVAAGICGLCG